MSKSKFQLRQTNFDHTISDDDFNSKKMLCPPTPYKTALTQSILLVCENVIV